MSRPVPTLVRYRAKPGGEARLEELVRAHWPTIHALGLATDAPARLWRAHDKRAGTDSLLELFEWRTETSSDVAHQTPEVMALWEPMGEVLESLEITQLTPL